MHSTSSTLRFLWLRNGGKSKKKLNSNIRSKQQSRVARWFIFKQKIQIWVKFGRPKKGLYILRPFGIYYGHVVDCTL
jgi:hypothetical protein